MIAITKRRTPGEKAGLAGPVFWIFSIFWVFLGQFLAKIWVFGFFSSKNLT